MASHKHTRRVQKHIVLFYMRFILILQLQHNLHRPKITDDVEDMFMAYISRFHHHWRCNHIFRKDSVIERFRSSSSSGLAHSLFHKPHRNATPLVEFAAVTRERVFSFCIFSWLSNDDWLQQSLAESFWYVLWYNNASMLLISLLLPPSPLFLNLFKFRKR